MTRPSFPALVLATSACAGPGPITGSIVEETVRSSFTTTEDGEAATYTILVRTPPGYTDDCATRYPVSFQLDATFNDELDVHAAVASELEAEGVLAPRLVVGIGHPPGGPTPQRDRDFLPPGGVSTPGVEGHADAFLAFLREQLVPTIDADWCTTGSEGRLLSGHSNGGVFAFYAFTEDADPTAPLFPHAIAADWGFGPDAFVQEATFAERATVRPGSLFLTHALYNGASQKVAWDALIERLDGRDIDGLRFGHEELATDHLGAIAQSLDAGLRFTVGGAE